MSDGLVAEIDVPKLGEFLVGNAGRAHNKIGKEAVRRALLTHHEKRIPGHFRRGAHQKYGYADRSPSYRHYKQRRYGSSIDLVMTGRTQHAMSSQAQITVGGTASGGTLNGQLKLRFPFGASAQQAHARRRRGQAKGAPLSARGRRDGKPRVTIEQMRREVATVLPSEVQEINRQLRVTYVDLVNSTTGSRQRVKV